MTECSALYSPNHSETVMAKRRDFSHWAERYENALKTRADYVGGRVCWNTAKNLHNQGASPEIAAITASRPFIPETQHDWRP